MPDVGTIPFRKADTNGHYKSLQLPNDAAEFMPALGLPAFAGDVVGPGGATAGQAVIFSDGTGKRIDAATQTGLAKLASGLLSAVPAPIGTVVGTTDVQTLTNKTLITPTITGLTGLTKNDVGLGNVDNTSDANKPVSGPQQAALNLKEDKANKGAANGYASLDASTKVPLSQIPDSVVGGQQYQGTWNAATNTPALPSPAIGNKGWYYSVNVAGSTVPPGGGPSSWAVGDQVISNGSVWQKIANVSAVNSVNGYTGVVVLGKNDVGLGNVDNTSDASKPVSSATVTQLNLKEDKANKGVANGYASLDATGKVPVAQAPPDAVTTVAGRAGDVVLTKTDVGLSNVDNTSDATKNSAAVTLTNKTINGAANTLTVRLASDVTGNLPVTNLNAGTGANSGSFWRGDGQWAPPAGGGDVVGPAGGVVDGEVVSYSGTTGKVLKATGGKLTASLVAGPASSVVRNLATFTDTTGKLIGQLGKTGLTTDFLDGTNAYQNLAAAVKPTIWSVRQRNFNALGNPNFEVDQRNAGNAVTANGAFSADRWSVGYTGTLRPSGQQVAANVAVPGSNFFVTSKILRLTLTTAQASLGASDFLMVQQTVEGPQMRELLGDVHSVSLLVRSSVANLKFSVAFRDGPGVSTRSLVKLCSMGAANTWTMFTLPNLPVWSAGGMWSLVPGTMGYFLGICLAAGTTYVAPAADVWQTGNYIGAPGMSNFASNATSSTFDMAFVQHEPGAECTTPIDISFADNHHECLRYFYTTFGYGVQVGAANGNGAIYCNALPSQAPFGCYPYKRKLARVPPVAPLFYSSFAGINNIRDLYTPTDRAVTSVSEFNDDNAGHPGLGTTNTASTIYMFHFSADTVW